MTANNQQQVQFKPIETRLLGPMSLLVQSSTEDNSPAKGIDLILPTFTCALEVRLYLPVPDEKLNGKVSSTQKIKDDKGEENKKKNKNGEENNKKDEDKQKMDGNIEEKKKKEKKEKKKKR